jgi:hypothetical protein
MTLVQNKSRAPGRTWRASGEIWKRRKNGAIAIDARATRTWQITLVIRP